MPQRQVCIRREALHPHTVPNVKTTLTTVHWLGRNGTSNNRDSNCRYSIVFIFTCIQQCHSNAEMTQKVHRLNRRWIWVSSKPGILHYIMPVFGQWRTRAVVRACFASVHYHLYYCGVVITSDVPYVKCIIIKCHPLSLPLDIME
jgi:hypothetical protein